MEKVKNFGERVNKMEEAITKFGVKINPNTKYDKEEFICYKFKNLVEGGNPLDIMIILHKNINVVDINISIMEFTKTIKENELLELINEINSTRRFITFTYEHGRIVVTQSLIVEDFSSTNIIFTLLQMIDVAIDKYPEFMKLQWG